MPRARHRARDRHSAGRSGYRPLVRMRCPPNEVARRLESVDLLLEAVVCARPRLPLGSASCRIDLNTNELIAESVRALDVREVHQSRPRWSTFVANEVSAIRCVLTLSHSCISLRRSPRPCGGTVTRTRTGKLRSAVTLMGVDRRTIVASCEGVFSVRS